MVDLSVVLVSRQVVYSCVDSWPSRNVPKRCLNVIPSDNSDKPIPFSVSGGNFLQCGAITPEMCYDSHDTSETFAIFSLGQTNIFNLPKFSDMSQEPSWGDMDGVTFINNLNSEPMMKL